ncbi:hypothetical protein [Lactiplantibacillus plantarum]
MAESNATQVILTDDGLKIIKAQSTADSAADGFANLNDPNLMSVIEKQSNVSQFAGLTSQYNVILQNAKDDGIDTTAVTTAYNNLNRFMADILADPDNASDVDRVTYKKYQDAYNEELSNLKIALQNNTNNKFTSAANATSQAASVASQAFSQAQSAVDYASSGIAVQYEATQKAQSAASEAVSKAESTASEFGKVSQKTDSAFDNAMSAQNAASSAVATAHSTASEFGNVSQKADSAVASALNAQSSASDAVKQASSAAADSKDAKQIAGAVSQSYKTLTDESTMTIAELESGLAVKLTKTDLDGYATETWAQNQINATADGINATLSSVKTTVDGQTTSINDLKADSSSFKSQFTTVNDTLGKQTTDIGNLQATSKELSSNFSSLNADNSTNKSDISELKQTATEVSSTLETVKTQVQNSAVGANLIVQSEFKNGYLDPSTGGVLGSTVDFHSDNYIATNGATVFTFSSPDYTFKGNGADDRIAMYDSDKNYLGYQPLDSPTQTLSLSNVAYIRFSINSADEGNTTGNASDWLSNHRYKLEKGSVATDYSVNPEDTTSVTAFSKLSQTVDGMKADISKKIEQKDLNGYATEIWAQNQINATADGINATLSSVKTTVDGQTTSINDLKADSSSFKSQFTTVNDTLGKQTTDIGNLQATSKELSSNFSSLNADNSTNKSDISELKQTATEVSSTLETVKTQVQNSAVGANLIVQSEFKNGYLDPSTGGVLGSTVDFHSDNYIATNGATVFTFSSPDYTFKGNGADDRIAMYDSNKNYLGYQSLASPTQTLSNSNVAYIRFCINSGDEGNTTGNSSDWLANHRYKLEKGSVATDYSVNPADTATQSQITQLSSDINLRVKKDGLISQINLQAKNTLISSGGQLTLAGDTVYFDTDKPVIIPSANIETVLVRKQLQAADISANTFTTNNGTFTVKQDGSITAKNMTLTGGTLTSPTINASTINGSTINGTTFHGGDIISNANNTTKYYPMTITPDGAYKSTYFDSTVGLQSSVESGAIIYKYRSMIGNGKYLAYDSVINGQGLNLQSGYTSAKDTTFSNPVSTTTGYVIVNANDGITLHGDNQQITFNGTSADTTPKGIIITPYGNINPNGTQNIWYVGNNMNMKTASFGMDGSGTYNIQFNRSLDIGNFNINTYHTITSTDNGPIHFNRNDGKSVDIYAATVNYTSLVKSSLLSLKKGVEKADTAYWAQLVNSIDLATYQYKSDDNMAHIRLSSIVDDVNDTKQWRLPDIFINRDENGKLNGVDDSVLLNATLATVQEQQKEIDQLNGHNMQLEARLNKLEAKLNG